MSLFTLTQKIFVIKCYYVGGESARHALKCMMKRYGKHFDQHNLDSIQQIIRYALTTLFPSNYHAHALFSVYFY